MWASPSNKIVTQNIQVRIKYFQMNIFFAVKASFESIVFQ